MQIGKSLRGDGQRLVVDDDGLVLRHENLHDAPADEISHSADAEDNHVAGRLALEAHELKGFALLFGIGEQCTGTLVDQE